MVTIEVHVRLGCLCQVFHFFLLGVSIDALDRISYRVGYIITASTVFKEKSDCDGFLCAATFRRSFLLCYVCMGVGFNFSFVVWPSTLDIFLHYGRMEGLFVFVLLFEPVLLGSSGFRKPR